MANFKISAKFINNIVQNLMLEGNYQKALNILDSISEITFEEKRDILCGKANLLDQKENEFIISYDKDLIDKEYKEKIENSLKKVLLFNNQQFTAYGYVDKWSSKDNAEMTRVNKNANLFTEKFNKQLLSTIDKNDLYLTYQNRSLYYADDPNKDLAYSTEDRVILFKRLDNEYPYFLYELLSTNPKDIAYSYLENLNYTNDNIDKTINIDNSLVNFANFEIQDNINLESVNIENIKNQIIDFTNNDKLGWLFFNDENNNSLKVPKKIFMSYATKYLQIKNNYDYKPFSPSGLKMANDCPIHTDLYISLDIDLDNAYDNDNWKIKLILNEIYKLHEELFNFKFHLISRAGLEKISGEIFFPDNIDNADNNVNKILVLPNLNIEYENVAKKADAIICETGGPLAHIVVVLKENKSIPIIRINDALIKFINGQKINIDFINGDIKLENKNKNKL